VKTRKKADNTLRIAVISPVTRSGASVVTAILAQSAALTQQLRSVITYTSPHRVLPDYMNAVPQIEDRTRSASQIVKLLQSDAITADELDEYAIMLDENCYMLDVVSSTITDEEALMVQKFVYTNIKADVVLCDISEALDDETALELISVSDAICYVLNPDTVSIEAFKEWKNSDVWPKDIPYFVVINRYADDIIGVRQFAKKCGISAKNTCKLHYNPYIVKSCNESFLKDIVPYAYLEKDSRVLQLRSDIKELMSWCTYNSGYKLKWIK
jgi:hypothetical protein